MQSMKKMPADSVDFAAADPDELRAMITAFSQLTSQMATLTAYFERAGERLLEQQAEQLDQAVQCILQQAYGAEESGSAPLQLAMPVMRAVGAEGFVKKLLWSEQAQDRALATALSEVVPPLESLVPAYPALLLSQATHCLEALGKMRSSGALPAARAD